MRLDAIPGNQIEVANVRRRTAPTMQRIVSGLTGSKRALSARAGRAIRVAAELGDFEGVLDLYAQHRTALDAQTLVRVALAYSAYSAYSTYSTYSTYSALGTLGAAISDYSSARFRATMPRAARVAVRIRVLAAV